MNRYRLTELFGWLNLLLALLSVLALPMIEPPAGMEKLSLGSVQFLWILVAAAMTYASKQKLLGSDIGHKAYPATLAAYLLFALICYRYLGLGG
ncbi:hypothetical protein [Motiliproteus sp.]|uniref:hypothetical protein n=1 Tax=Motiliproteus sp. TaxID=1898955 RepID=UPI003BAA748A